MNIAFRKVSKRFTGGVPWALANVSFEIEDGSIAAIVGASGAGKSTAIRLINRLIEPDEGAVYVGGTDVARQDVLDLRRQIGFVPQDYGLISHLNVSENIGLGLRAAGIGAEYRARRAEEMLELVGMDAARFGKRTVSELSGGQRQRVAIARALASCPRILLLDEPFAAIDTVTRRLIVAEIQRIRRSRAITILLVTHDIDWALRCADRVAVMRDGRLLQCDAPEVIRTSPADDFVRLLVSDDADPIHPPHSRSHMLSRAVVAALALCMGVRVHGQAIRVGAKNFTEQQILGEIVAQTIEESCRKRVDRLFNLGGTGICHGALVSGAIDLYVEYTGTAIVDVLGASFHGSPDDAFRLASRRYREEFDVTWFPPFGFENTFVLVVRSDDSEIGRADDISDLTKASRELTGGFTGEFVERPDGLQAIEAAYGLRFAKIMDIAPGLLLDSLSAGRIDVAAAFSTDGRIDRYGFRALADSQRAFPPYFASPIIRNDCLTRNSDVADALFPLAGSIDAATMRRLNNEVELLRRSVADVARDWIRSRNPGRPGAIDTPPEKSPTGILARAMDMARRRSGEIAAKTIEHAILALSAALIALAIGMPLAICVNRKRRTASVVIAIAEAIQTLPSLALLALLFALLRRLGVGPALVALVLYSLLPILLNTIVGLRQIPNSVHEVSESLGLTPIQRLVWVDLPQAAPSILAGARIAIVLAVGTATLSTYVGAGGLGDFIARGLARNDPALTLLGAVPAALLAVGLSALVKFVSPRADRTLDK